MSVTEPNKRNKGTCTSGTPKRPHENRDGAPRSGGVSNPRQDRLHVQNLPKPKGTPANRV